MATASTNLPGDAPTDELPSDLPSVPGAWVQLERENTPFDARAGWMNRVTGQKVTVEATSRPTQMHTPETSTDDTGFTARVHDPDGENRRLTSELAGKPNAYAAAVRFMAKYTGEVYELPERDFWTEAPVEW